MHQFKFIKTFVDCLDFRPNTVHLPKARNQLMEALKLFISKIQSKDITDSNDPFPMLEYLLYGILRLVNYVNLI